MSCRMYVIKVFTDTFVNRNTAALTVLYLYNNPLDIVGFCLATRWVSSTVERLCTMNKSQLSCQAGIFELNANLFFLV